MIHLRGLVVFLSFLPSDARRSIRTDDSHHVAQQQNNMLANSLEVSADARGALIPGGFGTSVFRRAGPHAGALREVSKQDGWRARHHEPYRVAARPRFGPRRANIVLQAASGTEENQFAPNEASNAGAESSTFLSVTGMKCEACVDKVERTLKELPGVREVSVDLVSNSVSVRGTTPAAELVAAITGIGFGAEVAAMPWADRSGDVVMGDRKTTFDSHVMGSPDGYKVCVCGGAGGIGQPLSMFMAMDHNVKEVSVYDLDIAAVPPDGVAADLAHIESAAAVKGYLGKVGEPPSNFTGEALAGCSLVLIPAGMPRKPGMTRDDLFKVNADIAKGLVEATAKFCPEAIVALIVNPVNSIVPAMAELYKKKGLDPKKIVGVTTLDCVRSNKFVSELTGSHPSTIEVPVIGGHAGKTILPIFSQDEVASTIDKDEIAALDKRVQDAGTEVVNAKAGKGSATLSMAYAGARLASCILKGLSGNECTECAYVQSDVTALPYFSSKVVFGVNGVEKVLPLGDLSDHEKERLAEASAALKTEIDTGLKYAEENSL